MGPGRDCLDGRCVRPRSAWTGCRCSPASSSSTASPTTPVTTRARRFSRRTASGRPTGPASTRRSAATFVPSSTSRPRTGRRERSTACDALATGPLRGEAGGCGGDREGRAGRADALRRRPRQKDLAVTQQYARSRAETDDRGPDDLRVGLRASSAGQAGLAVAHRVLGDGGRMDGRHVLVEPAVVIDSPDAHPPRKGPPHDPPPHDHCRADPGPRCRDCPGRRSPGRPQPVSPTTRSASSSTTPTWAARARRWPRRRAGVTSTPSPSRSCASRRSRR